MTPVEPLAVDAKALAGMLGLALRTIRRMDSAGKLPRPVKLGGAVRWNLAEVKAWLAAGAPERIRWESIKQLNNVHGGTPR